jgi:NTP pyrophosphatase (non-canonical NTP hydrolase)
MENNTINEIQEYVKRFGERRNWQTNPYEVLAHMIEELGEVARNVLHMKNYGGRHSPDNYSDIAEELADILYLTLKMANECNVNLAKAFSEKMEINEKRFPIST